MAEVVQRYWVYIRKTIRGPFYPKDIVQIHGFDNHTLVCPENELGQWREANFEPAFQLLISPKSSEFQTKVTLTHEQAESKALKSILEKAIAKNFQLENEVKLIKKDYEQQKKKFEEEQKKKDLEIKNLTDKLKRISHYHGSGGEHPSWEMLYKMLKGKMDEMTQANAEKSEEIIKLKNQLLDEREKSENLKKELQDLREKNTCEVNEAIKDLKHQLEEKETIIETLEQNLQSILNKNEEFQKILLDEKKDYEEKIKNFCEEIGKLRAELKWKNQEIDRFKNELSVTVNKIMELESSERVKTKEQQELFNTVQSKIKILTNYFENLENKLKYAFKKV